MSKSSLMYNINKPKGPTSHDIVDQVRKITGIRKVGHAGTLDPLASGVLVVAITREATKQIGSIVKTEKEYLATIRLGQTSVTDDEEGDKTSISNSQPDLDQIKQAISKFVGQISQIPPAYSAIKIKGQAAYKMARKGEQVKMKARQVDIKSINIESYRYPELKVRVITGPGVYIRSLARDIGESLTTGAYLSDLVRTRVGEYVLNDALSLDGFKREWGRKVMSNYRQQVNK